MDTATSLESSGTAREALKRRLERPLEAAVVVAALATGPLVVAQEQAADDLFLVAADWVLWAVFAVDYVLLTLLSRDRWGYARHHWLSAVIVLVSCPLTPPLLDLVRLARLGRLLRLAIAILRGVEALRQALGRPGFVYLAGCTGLLVLAGGGILTLLEPETVKHDLSTGLWWAVVTTTTVGYGDVAPVTPAGRVLGVILMFVGVGLTATLAATIAAYFVEQDSRQKEQTDLRSLEERLERIEKLLNRGDPEGPKGN